MNSISHHTSTLRRQEERAERPLRSSGAPLLAMATLALGAALPAQAQVVVQPAPQPGSLYLSDFFESKHPDEMAHGEIVARSAQQLGFDGPIVRQEVRPNPLTKQAHRFDVYLDQRQFTPEEMRQLLASYAENCQVGQMQTATDDLKMWKEQGIHHSAINLSRGCGQAQAVEAIYSRVQPAWSSFDQREKMLAQRRLDKMAPGLEADAQAMVSSNPAISGPARQAFQQKLVDLVARTSDNSQLLAQAQSDYDKVVQELADAKVSVVVAAANSGNIVNDMARDAHGLDVLLPENFWNNRLANSKVVTVGATGQAESRVAAYTNADKGIDFYADGDARVDTNNPDRLVNYGTSFATPRIGAILAELHKLHPDWSAEQVQQEARRLTQNLGNYEGYVTAPVVLNESARDFFQR